MTLIDREVAERRTMRISNATSNIGISSLLTNQATKQQKIGQELSGILASLTEGQEKVIGNRPNQASGVTDFLQSIRSAGEAADKLSVQSLVAEKTSCTVLLKDGEKEKEVTYFTFYEKDRIYCKRESAEYCEWEISLKNEFQYEKVMSFLNGLEDQENQLYTIHKTFWTDLLSGKLDIDDFKEFLATKMQDGNSDCLKITEDGTIVDPDAMKYSIYVYGPAFGTAIARTVEEVLEMQQLRSEKIEAEWKKTHLTWIEEWNKEHPNLVGTRCFLYSDGRWYTAKELNKLWNEEMKSDGTVFI